VGLGSPRNKVQRVVQKLLKALKCFLIEKIFSETLIKCLRKMGKIILWDKFLMEKVV
jgi:hypothetical protein